MRVTVGDVAAAIEEFAPLSLQEEYDNSGLQVGRIDSEVRGVLVCFDVSEAVLDEAEAQGCDMVVSHHPVLFRGIKSFTGAIREGNLVERAIKRGVTLYAAHTNLDFAHGGVSYVMGRWLGLEGMMALRTDAAGREMGVVGSLAHAVPPAAFLALLKARLKCSTIRYNAESSVGEVRRVALCGGSGIDLYSEALQKKADAFVTGDAKYHDFQRGVGQMLLVDVGHRESEWGAVRLLADIIREKIPNFAVHESVRDGSPVRYY